MSLIVCRQEQVTCPYYVEGLDIHISSSPELCYVLYQNPLLAMGGLVNDNLIRFIGEELDLPFLAGRLEKWIKGGEDPDEMIYMILSEFDYYTSKEIGRLRQRIGLYRKMSPAEFAKETADYYFSLRQYGSAVLYYEKILEDWRMKSLNDEFTARIWNNIGAAYAGIFWFDKAVSAYEMSYNFKKDPKTLKRLYQLTLLAPGLKIKERYQPLLSGEQTKEWEAELEAVMEAVKQQPGLTQVEALFDMDAQKQEAKEREILCRWKKEYRKMT